MKTFLVQPRLTPLYPTPVRHPLRQMRFLPAMRKIVQRRSVCVQVHLHLFLSPMYFPILPLLLKAPPRPRLPKLAVQDLLATFLPLVVGPLYEEIPRLAFAHLNGRRTSSTARTTSSPRHTMQTTTLRCALVFRRCFLVLPPPEVFRNQNRNRHRLDLLGLNQPHSDWYLNPWLWEKGPTKKTRHQMSKCVLRLAQSGPNNL